MRRVGVAFAVIIALFAAYFGWKAFERARPPPTVLPEFTEIPAGPRASVRSFLGATVGSTTLDEVLKRATSAGLSCKDTSARALMSQMREAKAKELADKKARGEEVDVKTGASVLYKRSPMENNPQVRLSCEGARSAQIQDGDRVETTGRLLFIFDSPDHPLRHVSFRRLISNESVAHQDLMGSFEAAKKSFGPPTLMTGEPPKVATETSTSPIFRPYSPFKWEWKWADFVVTVSALRMGERGIDVYEGAEIPWPVRTK